MLMKKDYVNLRKSKLLLLTLLAVLCGGVSPAWAEAKDLPYSYSFEDYNLATDGWTTANLSGLNSSEFAIVGAAKKTGSYGFRFSSYSDKGDNTQYLISPELNAPTGVTVTFAYAASSSSGTEKFKVGYSTTDAEIASFTFGDEISYNSTSWTTFEQTFPAGTKYVAVYYYANYQYRLYVDDFSFTTPPTCIAPTGLSVSEITSSSVQLSWTSDADNFNVQYKKAADADWTDVNGTISDNPYTLDGLESNTGYQARVRTYCDATDQSDWTNAVSFTTDCGAVTVFPFTETFNNITSGIPDCWNNSEGTTNTINNRWNYHASGHDGACVRFNSYNNTNGLTNFLKTPAMNLPAGKSMQLKFWYKNPTGGDFSVYISNDGGVTYTTELATGLTGASTWTEYEATIPVGFTDNVVIVFKGTSNYGNGDAYIYLDDVEISEAPACPKPTGLTASNATYNSVELAWTAGSDETEWKVIYGATGFDPASEGTTIDNVTTNPYTLTGLTPETAYDVYVKAVKGSDVSPVSNKANFATTERYPVPTGLAISNLTTTSATLTWTAGAATSWEVAINTTGETPATEAGTGTVVNTATYDFSELTAETTYYAFVREKDGENYSSWSAACEFTPSAYTYLTLNEETNTNSYVPITVNTYGSSLQRTQFVIPATNLTEMINKNIKKLTFYATTESNDLGGMEYDVYLKEVDNTTITSSTMTDWETMTNVYSGTLSVAGGKMNILLSADYAYTGKSLLVGIYQKTTGTGTSLSFYGKSSSNYMAVKWDASGNERTKFSPKTTIGYQAKTGSELKVFDGETELTASPASFDFGLATAGTTHTFTLKNTAATPYVATISSTNLTVSPTELTPTEEGVTFTVAMPEQDITDEAVVITPASESGLEPFTINVSGTLRDASKLYQEFNTTSLPDGWTTNGSWYFTESNGAYTTAWYIDSGTLTRLKTPMLTVAAGEKFIVEAKGYSTSNTTYQHLVLQYSADGTTWTTFSDDFGTTISTDPTNWKSFTATLPNEVEAGNYYIGILASQANIRLFYGGKEVEGANFAINVAAGAEQDFGQKVNVGAVSEKTYTITNNGNADLVVSFTDADDFKVVNGSAGLTVPAYSSATFTVQMVTTTQGEKSGNIVLTFDALNASSFTIPCKGTVLDPNYLIVDFSDGQFPEGWQVGTDWAVTSGYAVQSNTRTASAIITTPLIVAEGEKLKFKAARNASGQGNVTSLKTRYSTNGGATWSAYTNYNIETTGLTEMTLTGVPAGTVILEFLGSNIKLDDIEGFTKTTANALYLTDENGVVIEDGDKKDFGNLVNMMILADDKYVNRPVNAIFVNPDQGVVVNGTANAKIPAGKSVGIKLTVPFQAPYGEREGTLKIYFEESNFPKFAFVDYSANLIDPTDFVEDFEKNTKPAGWYSEWNYANGVAYINSGSAKPMITELIGVEEGKNELSFDAKVYYDYGTGTTQTLDVYTSADRKEWTLAKTVELTGDVNHVTLDALNEGSYYVKFEAANAQVDNIEGVKRLEAPAHDLFVANTTLPTGSSFVDTEINVTATVTSLRADETGVYAKLFVGDEVVATADAADIALDGSKTFSMAYTPNTVGEYEAYIKVYYSSEEVAFTTLTSTFEVVNYPSLVLDETSIEALSFATGTYDVTLNRSFAARWNTICLPFEVQVTDIHEDAVAYEFDSYNAELNELNFKSVTMLSAATPYVIYVPEAITTALEFKKQSMNSYYASASAVNSNGAKFQGTYAAIAAPGMEGKYGVTKDGKIAKGSDKASMKGFRAYFELPQVSQDVSGVRMSFLGETTGIKRVISSDMLDNHLYNLNGQPVQEVKKGLYIKNGKKVVIK